MKSFMGGTSVAQEFERNEFFRVFEVAKALERLQEPAQRRPAQRQDARDGVLPAVHAHPPGARSGHAPAGRARHRLFDAKMTRAGDFYQESIKDTVRCWNTMAM